MSVTVLSRVFPIFFSMSEVKTQVNIFFLKSVCLQLLKSEVVKCNSPLFVSRIEQPVFE